MTLTDIKQAVNVTVDDYNSELEALALAALADLGIAGVTGADTLASLDPITAQAVRTYVCWHYNLLHGGLGDCDRLAASYKLQKSQLMHATGHTDWGDLA